jgi:hypothetical protein
MNNYIKLTNLLIFLLFLHYSTSLELSANVATFGIVNKTIKLKVDNDSTKYFSSNLANDLKTVKKITWVNNFGFEVLTYNNQTSELLLKTNDERIKFDRNKFDLTIDNVRDGDIGTWKLYLQNSNAASILYIIAFEVSILKKVEMKIQFKNQSLNINEAGYLLENEDFNKFSNIFISCESEYNLKYSKLVPKIELVSNNDYVNQVFKLEKVSMDKVFNLWSLNLSNYSINDDISLTCVMKSPVDFALNEKQNYFISNHVEISSKKLVIKGSNNNKILKTVSFSSFNHSVDKNESIRLICESENTNGKFFWFNGTSTELVHSTNSTEYLVSLLNTKLKLIQTTFQNYLDIRNIQSDCNYTCLTFDYFNTTEYQVQFHSVNIVRAELNTVLLELQPKSTTTCKHCSSIIIISILTVLITLMISTFFALKFVRKRRNNSENSIPTQYKFYAELQRQFENSSVKQYQTDGNELKIIIS